MMESVSEGNILIIIDEILITCIVWRINVPADFDTKRKAFSGSKAPKKA